MRCDVRGGHNASTFYSDHRLTPFGPLCRFMHESFKTGADMKRMFIFLTLFGLTAICAAQGVGNIAAVTIVDRDSGEALSPYFYHGEYWVAGRPGSRYAIEIQNRLGNRLLAVTSVDGVNVVSGVTAAWDQAGYVFSAGEAYQITGWRKTDAEVAAFTFTESPNSYAARTGRPANVGVIGVAVFRERLPPPEPVMPMLGQSSNDGEARAAKESASPAARDERASAPAMRLPKLGTGHGEREYSHVDHTDFPRMQRQPNEVIRIRYDSYRNLVAMGIVKRLRPVLPQANPFPASPDDQYVPDPPG
jgi:hypothetical protein